MKNRIRILRTREGLTQEELGERVGLSHAAVQRAESGKHEEWIARAWKYAKALKCHPGELFAPLPNGPEISQDEARLLEIFRGMNKEQQSAFITMAKALNPRTKVPQPRAKRRA